MCGHRVMLARAASLDDAGRGGVPKRTIAQVNFGSVHLAAKSGAMNPLHLSGRLGTWQLEACQMNPSCSDERAHDRS